MPVPDASAVPGPAIDPGRAMPPLAPRPSTAEPAPRVGTRATAGQVLGERSCVHCGYNLRSASLTGRCPECGHAIGDAAPPRDGPLSTAAPHVIRSVALGSVIVAVAGTIAWAVGLLGFLRIVPSELLAWTNMGAALAWTAGIFVLTSVHQDAAARFNGMHERDGLRLAARWISAKVPVFAGLAMVPWIVARMPAPAPAPAGPGAAAPAGGAAALPPAAPLAGVADVLGVVQMIVLPVFLVAVILGLVIVHRIAIWARDTTAERFVHVAQWTIPVGALVLLSTGARWPGAYTGYGAWYVLCLFLIVHATAVIGLLSLAASTVLCVHHEREARERDIRRLDRRDEYHAEVAGRSARLDGTES